MTSEGRGCMWHGAVIKYVKRADTRSSDFHRGFANFATHLETVIAGGKGHVQGPRGNAGDNVGVALNGTEGEAQTG